MSFGQKVYTLTAGEWTQISTTDDANVTVENFATGAYGNIRIIAGATAPDLDFPDYRTLRPQQQHTYTNLDEGTTLWARASVDDVRIEVQTG